jgi:hypothetical protein
MTYAVRARIEAGDRLLFTSDQSHPVITRGAPRLSIWSSRRPKDRGQRRLWRLGSDHGKTLAKVGIGFDSERAGTRHFPRMSVGPNPTATSRAKAAMTRRVAKSLTIL